MVSFDVFVFGLVLANALNRPYRETSEVVSNLRKDGIVFFLTIMAIRVFNLAFSLSVGSSETFLVASFMWAIIAISICRLILRIEATEVRMIRLNSSEVWEPDTEQFELKTTNSEHSGGDA